MDTLTERAHDAYADSTPIDKRQGADWYPAARRAALRFHSDIDVSAGVIAALSPQSSWETNMLNAEQFLRDGTLYQNVPQVFHHKAARIVEAYQPTRTILRGPKERAFYYSIKYPDHTMHPACIDRHMICLLEGRQVTDDELRITPKQYERYSQAVCRTAQTYGTSIPEMQATLWIYQRGGAE